MVDAATAPDGKTESMEEILQSIKRIMDDDSETPQKAPEPEKAKDDVFELTNIVKDDGPMDEPAPAAKMPSPEPMPSEAKETAAAPAANAKDGLMSEQTATAAAASFRKVAGAAKKDDSIPSVPSPGLRGGNTVEDLLLEALRPMLKDWMDKNLPSIVQKIVEKEIKRIVSLYQD